MDDISISLTTGSNIVAPVLGVGEVAFVTLIKFDIFPAFVLSLHSILQKDRRFEPAFPFLKNYLSSNCFLSDSVNLQAAFLTETFG